MANDFPSTLGHARLPDIFKSIAGAGTPPKFNNEFLTTTLGYTSSNDRAIIPILRKLGFISAGGEPTQRYNDFKGHDGGRAVAKGLREGWANLFMADQEIYTKPIAEVKARVVTLTGANDLVSTRVANTFVKLCEIADWSDAKPKPGDQEAAKDNAGDTTQYGDSGGNREGTAGAFRLHHDVHIHLPATSDPAVYRAIFQAIKSELA
jgi:hypothetical protein